MQPQFHSQLTTSQPLPLQSTPFPQKSNQLPPQPPPNPNNKAPQQLVYNVKGQNFQVCMITPLGLNDVKLRSGRVFLNKSPPVVIQSFKEDKIPKRGIS